MIPTSAQSIHSYATLNVNNNLYYFGQNDNGRIVRLKSLSWTWSEAGYLNTARKGHSVILFGSQFMVVGGDGNYSTEACELENNTFMCTDQG